jgi:hypothetical protein
VRQRTEGDCRSRYYQPMSTPRVQSAIDSGQFDRFLHAVVVEQYDGVALTMLSVLARLDLDPWAAAANFARLPPAAAESQLARLIAESVSGLEADPYFIAACLVKLLPSTSAIQLARIKPIWPFFSRTIMKLKEALAFRNQNDRR